MKVDLDFVIHETSRAKCPTTWEGDDALAEIDLAAQAQPVDQTLVALPIVALEVVEQSAPRPHELEQPAAGVVVFDVGLKMLRQVVDSLAQQRNLDFGRPGVGWMEPVLFNQLLLLLRSNSHRSFLLFNRR